MNPPTPDDPRHPRLQMQGPRAGVPAVGAGGDLPYAAEPRRGRRRGLAAAGAVALLLGGAGVAAATGGGADEDRSSAPAEASGSTSTTAQATTTTEVRATTTTEVRATTTTEAPTTTTTKPAATTTTTSPTSQIPVDQLPRHEAVYRDGKLVLQGTVPTKEVRERFRAEAAAVIGAENVIMRYQIDPRVPMPTDGRVRVDEDFLFPKGSATIDPRYESLMQLGVTVM
ncbi:MAG TPA: hypothetical protein VHK88_16000, partial [Aquihabitans sp.]|nr:hypothetical protein [Aquihabitans sp.]